MIVTLNGIWPEKYPKMLALWSEYNQKIVMAVNRIQTFVKTIQFLVILPSP